MRKLHVCWLWLEAVTKEDFSCTADVMCKIWYGLNFVLITMKIVQLRQQQC